MRSSPDYLIIGHMARDVVSDGDRLGGTCSYSAVTARNLGQRTVAVTSAGPDIPSMEALKDIEIEIVPDPQSTTFENIYEGGGRRQKWLSTSSSLRIENVSPAWRNAPIVHLAPLAQEMSPAMAGEFPNCLVCVTMQGWLRGQDALCNVLYQSHAELESWLERMDVVILSQADVYGDCETLIRLATGAKLGVETLGPEGCRVYHDNEVVHVPVQPEIEVDPTGAGDIFAAAFFIRYHATGDFIRAAQFANACASLSVGKIGLAAIPTLSEVETRLEAHENRRYIHRPSPG